MIYEQDQFDRRKQLDSLDLKSDRKTALTVEYGLAMRALIDAEQALAPVANKMLAWQRQGRSRTAKDYAERKAKQAVVDEKQQVVDDIRKQAMEEDLRIYRDRLANHDLAAWEHKLLAENEECEEAYRMREAGCRAKFVAYGHRQSAYDDHARSSDLIRYEGDMIMAKARLEGFRAAMQCRRADSDWRPLPGWKLSAEPSADVRVYVRDHSEEDLP